MKKNSPIFVEFVFFLNIFQCLLKCVCVGGGHGLLLGGHSVLFVIF